MKKRFSHWISFSFLFCILQKLQSHSNCQFHHLTTVGLINVKWESLWSLFGLFVRMMFFYFFDSAPTWGMSLPVFIASLWLFSTFHQWLWELVNHGPTIDFAVFVCWISKRERGQATSIHRFKSDFVLFIEHNSHMELVRKRNFHCYNISVWRQKARAFW